VLVSYKDRLMEIFTAAIKTSNEHPEVRLMGILGLGLLCVLKDYMTQNEVRGVNAVVYILCYFTHNVIYRELLAFKH
jgi:hypothetical protein